MYDEVENATCMSPITWFYTYTFILCFPTHVWDPMVLHLRSIIRHK